MDGAYSHPLLTGLGKGSRVRKGGVKSLNRGANQTSLRRHSVARAITERPRNTPDWGKQLQSASGGFKQDEA